MDTLIALRRKIERAGDLESLVRTVKAIAAASMSEYEAAVRSLEDYDRAVRLGLSACLRQEKGVRLKKSTEPGRFFQPDPLFLTAFVAIGSDMGLVGQFNEDLADLIASEVAGRPGDKVGWVVGERLWDRLEGGGFRLGRLLPTPGSVAGITALIGELLAASGAFAAGGPYSDVLVFHNRPTTGELHQPVCRRLLPLDERWQGALESLPWPTKAIPEAIGPAPATLEALLREYLFVALFRACAESLASENASRLAAMQRASRNIDELLTDLRLTFHRLRQDSIDAELFDVVAGFEALSKENRPGRGSAYGPSLDRRCDS